MTSPFWPEIDPVLDGALRRTAANIAGQRREAPTPSPAVVVVAKPPTHDDTYVINHLEALCELAERVEARNGDYDRQLLLETILERIDELAAELRSGLPLTRRTALEVGTPRYHADGSVR